MTVTIPSERLANITLNERDALVDIAIGLYKREQVSLGRAAEISGLSSPEFLNELGRRRIPINYEAKDLRVDLDTLNGLSWHDSIDLVIHADDGRYRHHSGYHAAQSGQERLLGEIFASVIVPQAVWDELLAFHSHLPDFVLRRPVLEPNQRLAGTELLGRGEAEAIKLAQEIDADLLLTDDRKARTAATDLGIKCSGVLGLIVRAKQLGHLSSVRDSIDVLEKRGGLYLSDVVKGGSLKNCRRIIMAAITATDGHIVHNWTILQGVTN